MFVILTALLLFTVQEESRPQDEFKLSKTETRMIEAINKYRAGYKLPPLEMDPILMKVSRYRVPHYTHCYQGRWIWDECKRYNFKGFATDNLAQGQRSAEEAVDSWAHSSVGHAQQMRGLFKMNGRWQNYHFDKVGVAQCGENWIVIFGKSTRTEKID
jgi:uncharacterized protein YkwD